MSTDQVLTGIALIVVLAVGSQLLAGRLRVPALIILLPAGFTAGVLTGDVNPEKLLGPAFQPLVSLAVAVILYDAGLGLDVRKLTGHTRRVVIRLIALGVPVTWVIDPVGAALGAVVYHAVLAGNARHLGAQAAQFVGSLAVGLAGGAAGALLLWLLLRKLRLGEVLGTSTQLAVVVGVAAACDVAREDSGLMAAIVMGLVMANTRGVDIPARRPFFETLVQLIIGLLFVSISATVTPASLRHVLLPALGLAAILVIVVRPLVALVSTVGTDLKPGERAFAGWMAPRGIVAGATASTFSAPLAAHGIGGAAKILPATFTVIVATVALYGLTAVPVARRLGVMGPRGTRPLIVGADPWVVELAGALRSAGLDVLMWAGLARDRERISQAGLELAPGELLASATGSGAELEGVTSVLLLTEEDDFNALAATILQATGTVQVGRLAPADRRHGAVAPFMGGDVLFGQGLTRPELIRRQDRGARVIAVPAGQPPDGYDLLFVVRQDGSLEPVTDKTRPSPRAGDTSVLLGRAGSDAIAPAEPSSRAAGLLPGAPG